MAILVALTTFRSSPWLGILSDLLTSLYEIQHELYHPKNAVYIRYGPIIEAVVAAMFEHDERSLPTILRKDIAHTKVIGNEFADTASKQVVTSFLKLSIH